MNDMRGPGRRVLVRDPVEPVEAEVDAEQQRDRRAPASRRRSLLDVEQANVFEQEQIAGKQQPFEKHGDDLIDDAAAQIVDRVVEAIQLFALQPADDQLDADQQKEKRHSQRHVIDAGAENRIDERTHQNRLKKSAEKPSHRLDSLPAVQTRQPPKTARRAAWAAPSGGTLALIVNRPLPVTLGRAMI